MCHRVVSPGPQQKRRSLSDFQFPSQPSFAICGNRRPVEKVLPLLRINPAVGGGQTRRNVFRCSSHLAIIHNHNASLRDYQPVFMLVWPVCDSRCIVRFCTLIALPSLVSGALVCPHNAVLHDFRFMARLSAMQHFALPTVWPEKGGKVSLWIVSRRSAFTLLVSRQTLTAGAFKFHMDR